LKMKRRLWAVEMKRYVSFCRSTKTERGTKAPAKIAGPAGGQARRKKVKSLRNLSITVHLIEQGHQVGCWKRGYRIQQGRKKKISEKDSTKRIKHMNTNWGDVSETC